MCGERETFREGMKMEYVAMFFGFVVVAVWCVWSEPAPVKVEA